MSGNKRTIKRRVWVGLAVGTVGVVAWTFWFQSHMEPPSAQIPGKQPFVQLAGAGKTTGNRILQEKAELLDPTPLFFPTEWNYGQRPLDENRLRQPGQFFVSFAPKLTVPDQGTPVYGLETVQAPEKLSDVLTQGNEAPFAGMGQIDLQGASLPLRSGYLEVRRLGDSQNIINQTLTGIQLPRSDFAPIEFLVLVGPEGLIGDLLMTSGSGWDEVDSFFRTYLAKSYHLGERLAPGRYRVVVGA